MQRPLVAVLSMVVVLAMVFAWWRYLAVGDEGGRLLRLTEIDGKVQVEGIGGVGPAERGQRVNPGDRLATAEGARAVLSLGDNTHIRVGSSASLEIIGVDERGVSLELENGALQATVRPESGAVRVGSRGRAVLATNGAFEVGVVDDILQVNAVRGDLALSGVDQTRLQAGTQAIIVDRHAEVGAVGEELLLAVEWPNAARTRDATTMVSGRTTPGAQVKLTGSFGVRTVVAKGDGRFSLDLPLAEGENAIEVVAVDLLGRQAAVDGLLQTRDTQGPSFRGGVDYGGP